MVPQRLVQVEADVDNRLSLEWNRPDNPTHAKESGCLEGRRVIIPTVKTALML